MNKRNKGEYSWCTIAVELQERDTFSSLIDKYKDHHLLAVGNRKFPNPVGSFNYGDLRECATGVSRHCLAAWRMIRLWNRSAVSGIKICIVFLCPCHADN